MTKKTEQIVMTLPVQLTTDELLERGKVLATATIKLRELDSQKKEMAKQLKGQMDVIDAEIHNLEQQVESGTEPRQVDCEISWDYQNGTIRTMRLDTHEIISERDMTLEERQLELDG